MRRYQLAALIFGLIGLGALPAQAQSISAARAREIALASVSNNQGVKSEKLKTVDGMLVYEFNIETPGPGHSEVRIDANTGTVLKNEHEDDVVSKVARKTEHAAN